MKFLFEHLSQCSSIVHSLDARVKVAATLIFTVAVVSVPSHHVGHLFLFFAWPAGMIAASRLPLSPFVWRALALSPFILLVVVFNPFFEQGRVVASILGLPVTLEGLLTSAGIMVKFFATMGVMLVLMATTPFPALIGGIRGLGVPAFLTHQIAFLYRYLFILLSQVRTMKRARDTRSYGRLPARVAIRSAASILGVLFVRTLETGERVELAMALRGFDGTLRDLETRRAGPADGLFLLLAVAFCVFCWWMAHERLVI